MDQTFVLNIVLLVAIPGSFFVGYGLSKLSARRNMLSAQNQTQKIIEEALREAENKSKELELEARSKIFEQQTQFEQEITLRREDFQKHEQRLEVREDKLDQRLAICENLEKDLKQQQESVAKLEKEWQDKTQHLEGVLSKQLELLEKASGLTAVEAKRVLMAKVEHDLQKDQAVMIRKYEQEALRQVARRAKDLIAESVKKYGAGHVAEVAISVVQLPSDDVKGRVIGREGRNIRALEAATGVSVIVDDTPEMIVLSGFDPIRREVARMSLERLIKDGRIHPSRIDEVVEKVQSELAEHIESLGHDLINEVGLQNVHPEIIKLLGRLNYRTSYGQNIWHHSKEVAYLMAHFAEELGLDIDLAKRVGLLHDLGKAVTHEVEGGHAWIGADLARKYQEDELVVNAIEAHHEDVEPESIYAVLVAAADAISASRPGARCSNMDEYVNRLDKLESLAKTFNGVEKSFALQAGREVRVVVKADQVNDDQALLMARDLAKRIEDEMVYPGQIKVSVIRESKAVEYAK